MKKVAILLVIAMIFIWSGNSFATDWIYWGTDTGSGKIYYDADSLEYLQTGFLLVLRYDLKDRDITLPGGLSVSSFEHRWEFNCQIRKCRHLGGQIIWEKDGRQTIWKDENVGLWIQSPTSFISGADTEEILDKLCR
jgi:hypothetical protein